MRAPDPLRSQHLHRATTISGGALQIGNGGTTGSLATSAVTNNATLVYNRSNDFSVGYAISGSGQLDQTGCRHDDFDGTPAAYSGDTTISAGTLKLNQSEHQQRWRPP